MANTRIPARAARWEVEATVVAAEPPRATTAREVAHARFHEALSRGPAPRAQPRPGRSAARRPPPRSWRARRPRPAPPTRAPAPPRGCAHAAARGRSGCSRGRRPGPPFPERCRRPQSAMRIAGHPRNLAAWGVVSPPCRHYASGALGANAIAEVPSGHRTRRRGSILIAGQSVLLAAALIAAVVATDSGDWQPWSLFFALLGLAILGEFLAVPTGPCTSARPSSPPPRPWRCSARRPRR